MYPDLTLYCTCVTIIIILSFISLKISFGYQQRERGIGEGEGSATAHGAVREKKTKLEKRERTAGMLYIGFYVKCARRQKRPELFN